MDRNTKPPFFVLAGIFLFFLSIIGALGDIKDFTEWLRKMTGFEWELWNTLCLLLGLSLIGVGVYMQFHSSREKDSTFKFFFAPALWAIAQHKQFESWAETSPENEPMGILKRTVYPDFDGIVPNLSENPL